MGRLIDADALIEKLTKYKFGAISNDIEREYIKETVLNFINEQPTAYNVDKVVAELKDMKLIRVEQCHGDYEIEVMTSNNFVDAIEIVRKGGVE